MEAVLGPAQGLAAIVRVRFQGATGPARSTWTTTQRSCQVRSFRSSAVSFREASGGSPGKTRGQRKVFDSVDEAVADIKSGSTILTGLGAVPNLGCAPWDAMYGTRLAMGLL